MTRDEIINALLEQQIIALPRRKGTAKDRLRKETLDHAREFMSKVRLPPNKRGTMRNLVKMKKN